jgi:hypothetical protein
MIWTGRLESLRMAEVTRKMERQVDPYVEIGMIMSRQHWVEQIVIMNQRRGVWRMDSMLAKVNITMRMAKEDTEERMGSSCLEYLFGEK